MIKHFLVAAVAGVFAGAVLTVAAVFVGTLIFGTYGYGLFVLTPFVIGVITAYLANRKEDIGNSQTAMAVLIATGLGCLVLVLIALEGAVCIVMAAPLGLGLAWLGGL